MGSETPPASPPSDPARARTEPPPTWPANLPREPIAASAATALAALMGNLSEDHWCAGWMDGTERALWAAIQSGAPRAWGAWSPQGITDAEVYELRSLSLLCGGWIVWADTGETFVPMVEWLRMVGGRS